MTVVYFAGNEDSAFLINGSVIPGSSASALFRSAFTRGYLAINSDALSYVQTSPDFSSSSFWYSGRVAGSSVSGGTASLLFFLDGGIIRLRLIGTGVLQTFNVQKVNAAGTATTLGSVVLPLLANTLLKIDIHVVYSTTGSIDIYTTSPLGTAILVFSYSGDVTTDSATTLSSARMGFFNGPTAIAWSEIMILDQDTRSCSLQTLQPVANGNTHNFDTGTPAAANVNEFTLNDSTLDGSTTAGQIDQYTIPALATGTYSIIALGVAARMIKGTLGPANMDLGVRTSSTDYWSSDQALTINWSQYANWWVTNPNTGLIWTALPTNIGLKSVT